MKITKILEADLYDLPTGEIHAQVSTHDNSFILFEYTTGDEGGIVITPQYQASTLKALTYAADTSEQSAWVNFYVLEPGTMTSSKSCVSIVGIDENGMFKLPASAFGIETGINIECNSAPSAGSGGSIKLFYLEG